MDRFDEMQKRFAELEARVSALEGQRTPAPAPTSTSGGKVEAVDIVCVSVTNKRYQPQNLDMDHYQDHIWFDCVFSATALLRPARAVKGTLEFCDLFGEPLLRVGYTLNEPLSPDSSITVPDIGFEFNQFMSGHQWMLGTDLEDMTVRFRVSQILYQDGTNETGIDVID